MLTGKGMYIWKIKECDGGDIAKIVSRCVNAKFSHVLIKIANGVYGYNCLSVDKAKELADALKAVNIEPWGWQYVFGDDPVGEARTATRRMNETGCVGFVINAEQQYRDLPNNQAVALQYAQRLLFETPIALSSYRYPKLHGDLPWLEFLSVCDLIMPQVYWMQATNSADQLWQCVNEYSTFTDLPILPTGAAFCEHGWCPTNEEIIAFADEAKRLGLPGVNFWEYACSRKDGFWQTVRDLEYFEALPPFNACDGADLALSQIEELERYSFERFGRQSKELDTNAAKIKELQADIHALERWQVEMPTPGFLFEELDKIETNATEIELRIKAHDHNYDRIDDNAAEIDTLRQREIDHTREHNAEIERLGIASSNHFLRLLKQKNDIAELRELSAADGLAIKKLNKRIDELELQNNHTHHRWLRWIWK